MKGVSKIGKKRISGENNNTLGDIDVFAINRKQKIICYRNQKILAFQEIPMN